METEKKIEIEVALRDTVSLTLKRMADNLDAINQKMGRAGQEVSKGADGFKQVESAVKQTTQAFQHNIKSTEGFGVSMGGLLGILGRFGPAAWVAAGVTVGKLVTDQIAKISNDRLRLKAISQDTGLTEDQVSVLQRYGRRIGLQDAQSNELIASGGGALLQLQYSGTNAKLFANLSANGFIRKANELVETVRGPGGVMAGIQKQADQYAELFKINAGDAARYAQTVGIPEHYLKDFNKNIVGLTPQWKMAEKTAQDFVENLADLNDWLSGRMKMATYQAMRFSNWFANTMLWSAQAVSGNIIAPDIINPRQRKSEGLSPLTQQELETIQRNLELEQIKEHSEARAGTLAEIAKLLQGMADKNRIEGRWMGGPVLPGREYQVGEYGPETFSSDGMKTLIDGGGRLGGLRFRPSRPGVIDPFYSSSPQGSEDFPRDPMGTAEENWTALNKALKGFYGQGAGTPEGRPLPYDPADPSILSLYESFKFRERQMEADTMRMDRPPGFDDARTWEKYSGGIQPISSRGFIDDDGRGSTGVSLEADIDFRNVPEGVMTEADGDGFDNFNVKKSRQLEGI